MTYNSNLKKYNISDKIQFTQTYIKKYFKYLTDDYGFNMSFGSYPRIAIFQSAVCEITFLLDMGSIYICITPLSKLALVGLDEIILFKNPKSNFEYTHDLMKTEEAELKKLAGLLLQYCGEIFKGDFSIWENLKIFREKMWINKLPNEKIRMQRRLMQLSNEEAANLIGLSVMEYFDIEQHKDEIYALVQLRYVKILCNVLRLDFYELLGIKCSFCEEAKPYNEDYKLPPNELIYKSIQGKGLSKTIIAGQLDVDETVIEQLEINPNYLEEWRLDQGGADIKTLSIILDIPLQILAGARCNKCGR